MATAQQIISSAFRKCKIKKPGVTELNDAFGSLNDMLGSFGAELATNALVRESFALTALTTTISLPTEYIEAIVYNLAVRLAEGHTMDVPASVVMMADGSRMLIGRLSFANEVMLQGRFPLTEKERAEYKGASAYSIYASGVQRRS